MTKKKLGRLRRISRKIQKVTGTSSEWLGGKIIRENSSMIVTLWKNIRKTKANDHLVLYYNKSINLIETALYYNISVEALEDRIQQRKNETASKAKIFFLLGLFFSCYWFYQVIFYGEWTIGKFLMEIFIVIFPLSMFSLSMLYAWINWQIRNLYLGSFKEFIQSGSILPKSY